MSMSEEADYLNTLIIMTDCNCRPIVYLFHYSYALVILADNQFFQEASIGFHSYIQIICMNIYPMDLDSIF
jgi:hypothetical protein